MLAAIQPPTSHAMGPDVVPEAGDRGRQVGIVPPAQRVTGHYERVTAEEAVRRAAARARGEMPRIVDGLDGPGREKTARTVDAVVVPAQVVEVEVVAPAREYVADLAADDSDLPSRAEDNPGYTPALYRTVPAEPQQPVRGLNPYVVSISNEFYVVEFAAAAVAVTDTAVLVMVYEYGDATAFSAKPGSRLGISVRTQNGSEVLKCSVFVPSPAFLVSLDSNTLSVLVFLKTE